MSERPRRVPKSATVVRTEQVARDLVRVILTGDDIAKLPPLDFTDHYVKLLFPPAGADYDHPFDADEIRENHPREQWPVTRTYTIRWLDLEAAELALDFVVHGDEGLAGPWAMRAKAGDQISFMGPGGAWGPSEAADVHLLVGDESAAPAIAAAMQELPESSTAQVFVEVEDPQAQIPLPERDNVHVTWAYRATTGAAYGEALTEAVRNAPWPEGRVHAFVHGNADMIKPLRRYLFVERELPRDQVSISGYWRTGHNEDAWQAGKRDFNAQIEQEEAKLAG